MEENIIIEELIEFTPAVADRVRNLVLQLDQNFEELSDHDLQTIMVSPDTHLLVAKDKSSKEILGMITLVTYRIPYKKKGWLEDLVVDESARGKGIGTMLLEAGIEFAKKKGLKAVDLTSHPSREKANEMYTKKGFENRGTNVFRIKL